MRQGRLRSRSRPNVMRPRPKENCEAEARDVARVIKKHHI